MIELLIVVAIIAILAAIAVPNFLEAQTRAKVSRVKADMRSMATAIESYRIDWNRYPCSADDFNRCGFMCQYIVFTSYEALRLCTTPQAYMTSIPIDIFNLNIDNPTAVPFRPGKGSFFWTTRQCGNSTQWSLVPQPGWGLTSIGPDVEHSFSLDPGLDPPFARVYDPTNGTLSAGDIVRVGPGTYFGAN
jgi:type II secretory pathway pseudopilin PulG